MRSIRIIARLDVKSEYLVKGIQLEGLKKLGNPNDFALRYYEHGIDEIIYMDIVASLYERNSLLPIIEKASDGIFIPLTVGGGIRSVENVRSALHAGADKVAINTAAIKNPQLLSDSAEEFGSQCIVASIEAKSLGADVWEVYYDNGREKTGMNVLDWAKEVESRGAGEILLTSVDREGMGVGMDVELIARVCDVVRIPVIASGGVGEVSHVQDVLRGTGVSAIALAKILHYGEESAIGDLKSELRKDNQFEIR